MSRLVIALAALTLINGCSTFRQQSADCSCGGQPVEGEYCDGQYDCDNGDCSDCLPPRVAGKYFYHRHLDKFLTVSTAQKCARRDLKMFDDCGDLSRDFRDGYQQAYIDLALARPACVPAVPPKKYWHAWHRSCAGRDAVDQWYDGYRNGLDYGLNSGVSRFNRIVGNPESCCASAAYVSPYASSLQPSGVMPLDGQTISDLPNDNSAENLAQFLQGTPAQQQPTPPPSEAWPASYGKIVPAWP
jgi:hypothetical protein